MGCPQDQQDSRPGATRTRRGEIAAAFAIVAGGIAVIAGIVVASPGWQKLFTAWHASFANHDRTEKPGAAVSTPSRAAAVPFAVTAAPAPQRPLSPPPARATDSPRPVERARPEAPHDMAEVMATVLIAQLGQDPAWRTALVNADAHPPDSPEHAYWRRVAAAIKEGGIRLRQ
jgi:hypothetical protein